MHNIKTLYYPEGESGAGGNGGGPAVSEAPPPKNPDGSPDISKMEMGDAIASVFKTEPRQTQRREPKIEPKVDPKAAPKAEKKAEPPAKTADLDPTLRKRTSILDPIDRPAEAATPASVDITEAADDSLPENDWKAAKAVRKQLRSEIAAREERLTKAEKELASYHELVPDPAEVKRLREEHKAFSDKVAILDYQSHPDFRRSFVEPKQKLVSEMKVILADNGIEGFDIAAVAGRPRAEMAKAISEVTDKLNSFDAGEFRLGLREYQKISSAEQAALANHTDGMKQLNEQSAAKQRTVFEGRWKSTSLASFAEKIPVAPDAPPEEVESTANIHRGVDAIRGDAERYAFAIGNEETAADVAIKAANYDFVVKHAFPRMQYDYQKVLEQNRQMAKKLEELSAHKPGNFDGGSPNSKPESMEDMDIKSAVAKTFRSR